MAEGHAEHRIDSWRTGALVLLVALAAGFVTARWLGGDRTEDAAPRAMARPLMGTLVTVSVPAGEGGEAGGRSAAAMRAALAEVARVDSLFSWRLPPPAGMSPGEQTEERRRVLDLGLEVQRRSGGAFDPRMMPLVRAWGFDGGEPRVPPDDEVDRLVAALRAAPAPRGVEELESRPDVLHFGAWAKGYAVDRAVAELRMQGQPAALVDAGGEVRGYGHPWTVGVQHPRVPGALVARLRPGTMAVATSGDYEQFFEQDGRRFHHLLDPRTGRPATGARSVTVLAPSCAHADALATAVFVLGPDDGLRLIERLPGVEALVIDADGRRHESTGLAAYLADD